MHDRVGEIPVVGQQQHPLRVLVQPADGIHPHPHVPHQLLHALAAFFVAHGGDIAAGLVEQDVHRRFRPAQPFAGHQDNVPAIVRLVSQLRHPAVDLDSSLLDELLRLPPGGHTSLGKQLLQSYFRHRFLPFLCRIKACKSADYRSNSRSSFINQRFA